MTTDRDTIIRMAREAGVHTAHTEVTLMRGLERFTALIEQHLIQQGYRQCAQGQRTTQHCGLLEAAVREEREACALACEGIAMDDKTGYGIAEDCAIAIRARGEKT